jgi:hypothetical protein
VLGGGVLVSSHPGQVAEYQEGGHRATIAPARAAADR